MDARFMRNAGGFGAMFFLYPTDAEIPPLEFAPTFVAAQRIAFHRDAGCTVKKSG
jgi:hypothetical protein